MRSPRNVDRQLKALCLSGVFATERVPRALSSFYKKEVRNSRRDGGRPSKAARQGEALNDLKLLGLRALVVSVEEKAFEETSRMEQ